MIMGKKVILTYLLLLFAVFSYAQIGELRNNLSIGANGGALYNKVDYTPRVGQDGYYSYQFGGTIRYISEKYMGLLCGVQIEANFVDKGWREEKDKGGFRRSMSYVEIPFFANIAYGNDRVRGVLNLGPQFSFLLSERDFNKPASSDAYNHNHYADKKFDYGITGGLGVELRSLIGNFILEGRYYFGLSDIYNNGKTDYYARSAHNTISLKLTYLFDLIK